MSTRKPKPLVNIELLEPGKWMWACDRCGKKKWTDSWSVTLNKCVQHAIEHEMVGFKYVPKDHG